MMKIAMMVLVAACACGAFAGEVTFEETTAVLPTYAPGGYDKTPIFFTGRVYQGAQGRVYPYPMQDVLFDGKVDETYKYLTLENDWLQMGLLPEHGGHLLNFTDRQTGFETFYRQHVIKPALVGMLGASISGGVEWNFPHYHRATTAMPIDWRATDDPVACGDIGSPKGTKTVWIGETELRRRLKWTIGLSLLPDRAVLQVDNRFMNRGPFIESMICCANVSNRHTSVGKKFFLWRNFPEAHVWGAALTDNDGPYLELMVGCWSDSQPDYSWIAPYETRRVKQFWFPVKGIGGVKNVTVDGAVNVDRRGTDELLVGFYSTRVLSNCTVRVVRGKAAVFTEKNVALDPNTPWCKPVKVPADAVDQEFTAEIADADGRIFLSYTPVGPDPHEPLPPKVENPKVPYEYASAELAYEVGLRLDQFQNGLIDPEPYYRRALEIDPDYTRANLALGVRLAKNGAFADAKPYLERAVKRATQNHTRALDAAPEYYLAVVERELGNLKRAEDLFWRCTWRQTYKKESFFEIVRLCLLQGRLREAHDILEFNALPLGMDEAKFHTVHAYIHRKLKDCPEAIELHRANWNAFAANNQKKAFACDPLEYWGRCEEAFREGTARAERTPYREAMASAGRDALAAAEKNRGLKAQQLLECVADYWGLGAWDEVIALCDAALAKAAVEKPYATEGALPLKDTLAACDSYRNPMFGYFKAYAMERRSGSEVKGDGEIAKTLEATEAMPTGYCFPSRLEELAVLQWTVRTYPDAVMQTGNTHYYLGEILWSMDQKTLAQTAWHEAVAVNPKHALAWRCLGFAFSHPGTYFTNTGVPSGIASKSAYRCYLKSLEADPENFRTLDEAGKLAEKLNLPAAERLALQLKYPKAHAKARAHRELLKELEGSR